MMALLHTVADGETLSQLAQGYYGDATLWPVLFAVNRAEILKAQRDHHVTVPADQEADFIFAGTALDIPCIPGSAGAKYLHPSLAAADAIDYRDLLRRYIAHVDECEGMDYLGNQYANRTRWAPGELAELRKLANRDPETPRQGKVL